MLKRILYGAGFAIIFIGLLLLVVFKKTHTISSASLFDAIPGGAVVILENVDYEYLSDELLDNNLLWRDLADLAGMGSKDSLIRILINKISGSSDLEGLIKKENLGLSFQLVGKDKLKPVFYIDYSDDYSAREVVDIIQKFLGNGVLINERRYEAEPVYDISADQDYLPDNFSFTCIQGMLIVSPTAMLVDEAIRTLNSDNEFEFKKGFQKVRSTSGRYVHANIYVNYRELNKLFYPFVGYENWSRLNWMKEFAGWGEMDADFKDDAIILNGMSEPADSLNTFLNAFEKQSPVKIEMTDLMPSNTFYFIHMGIENKEKFYEGMREYLATIGEQDAFDQETERIKSKYDLDPIKDLMELMEDEIVWFTMDGNSEKLTSEIFAVEVESRSLAVSKLNNWYRQYLSVNKFEPSSLITSFRLDNQTSFEIYRLPDRFYRNQGAGRFFNNYYTVYDKYILFGPNVESLSAVIYQNVLHKTLNSDPIFEDVSEFFSSRANISLYVKPLPFLTNREGILNSDTRQLVSRMEPMLGKIPGIIIQYSGEDGMYYNSIVLKYSSQIKERALTVWESLLDTVAIIKPSLVLNHNTSEKEILIQDAKNRVYLINSTGRILWSMKIEGPVMSEIYQIDFYKNNKLQYLFNTSEKIHLIDRNGNYVERYPINLRSGATNPMSLFDYDNSRDYRIFIAGEDRKIYLYDMEGNVITGWRFRGTEDIVTQPLQYFRIDDTDYIIAHDSKRLYILDRRGREKLKTSERLIVSKNNELYLDMNIREGKPRWISTDTTGNVFSIYTNGNVEDILDHEATPDHFFRMQDMDRDGMPDFIFVDRNELEVITMEGKRLFSFKTKSDITGPPDIYKFSASDLKIGITDAENDRIYLINSDGSLHEGFPLEGNTRFSIGYFAGSDSRFNLIVGSSSSFLYNYSIE